MITPLNGIKPIRTRGQTVFWGSSGSLRSEAPKKGRKVRCGMAQTGVEVVHLESDFLSEKIHPILHLGCEASFLTHSHLLDPLYAWVSRVTSPSTQRRLLPVRGCWSHHRRSLGKDVASLSSDLYPRNGFNQLLPVACPLCSRGTEEYNRGC